MNKPFARHSLTLSFLSLLAAGCLAAQDRPGDNMGIAIEQVGVLAYPPAMIYDAVSSGEVRIAISVDEKGRLADHLVVGYTHEAFARSAVTAIKRWKYQPALVRGEPRLSRTEVLFEFRDQGVIVQTLPGALDRRLVMRDISERYVYRPCRLSELDLTPMPIPDRVVEPVIKSDGQTHHVTVAFYIDEEGRVRMPAVDRVSADDYYAAAAVVAVEQWRFEPPVRKGRKVLVYAQQEFIFRPKEMPEVP